MLETGDIPAARKLRGKLPAASAELDAYLAENPAQGLVELSDIRGDLHAHTTLSDGRNTLKEMAQAAKARGYAYLAITDHSASHGFGDNVTAERLAERVEEVRAGTRRSAAFASSRAPRSTSPSTVRSTTPRTCSPNSTG